MRLKPSQISLLKANSAILKDLQQDKLDGENRVGPYTIEVVHRLLDQLIIYIEKEQEYESVERG